MKKWTKLITLSSVAVLTSASSLTAFANDSSGTIPASTDVPAVVTVPSTGETTPTTPPVSDTTAPSVPSQPTQPTTGNSSTPSTDVPVPSNPTPDTSVPATSNDNVKPTQPATNNDSAKPTQPTTSNPTDSTTTQPASTDTAAGSGVTVPTVDGGSAVLNPNISVPTNNPNVSAQTAVDAGASQVGTTSQVTGQVVANVNSASPIQTNTGYQVISTRIVKLWLLMQTEQPIQYQLKSLGLQSMPIRQSVLLINQEKKQLYQVPLCNYLILAKKKKS